MRSMSHDLPPDPPAPPASVPWVPAAVAAPAPDLRAQPGAPRSAFAIAVPDILLARARRGEPAAFEQIYRWFERPVFTLALRLCGDREEASEVLQETMLKVLRGIGDYRGSGPFWGWLRQIAINEALLRLRRGRRLDQELALDGHDLEDAAPPPPAAADAALLQRALAALPAATRSVLWLYHAEGHTHEEIAALMQRSPSFSKSQLARGTRRLRALLQVEESPRMNEHTPSRATDSWHEAFAALPLEAPPADAWPKLAPHLAPPRRHPRRALSWAIAACTAALAALPALLLVRHAGPTQESATPAATTRIPARAAQAGAVGVHADARPDPAAAGGASAAGSPPAHVALDQLQAESARLEALLAELSVDGPVDGAQLALVLALQAQVGEVDAALAAPALAADARAELWQRRVALLRELAAVASDQRWDALFADASSRYALVQVY